VANGSDVHLKGDAGGERRCPADFDWTKHGGIHEYVACSDHRSLSFYEGRDGVVVRTETEGCAISAM
jgi:hypothetical protein